MSAGVVGMEACPGEGFAGGRVRVACFLFLSHPAFSIIIIIIIRPALPHVAQVGVQGWYASAANQTRGAGCGVLGVSEFLPLATRCERVDDE